MAFPHDKALAMSFPLEIESSLLRRLFTSFYQSHKDIFLRTSLCELVQSPEDKAHKYVSVSLRLQPHGSFLLACQFTLSLQQLSKLPFKFSYQFTMLSDSSKPILVVPLYSPLSEFWGYVLVKSSPHGFRFFFTSCCFAISSKLTFSSTYFHGVIS